MNTSEGTAFERFHTLHSRGNELSSKGDFEGAREAYLTALEISKAHPQTFLSLAHTYRNEKKREKALRVLQNGITYHPNYSEFYTLVGIISLELGEIEQGEKAYLRALELDEGSTVARHNLGNLYENLGQYEKAEHYYRSLIAEHPTSSLTLSSLGNLYLIQGEYLEAISMYSRALLYEPNNSASYFNRILAQLAIGDFEQGFAGFEQVFRNRQPRNRNFTFPVWNGSDPRGKRILLTLDQSSVDAIMFIRYAPLLAERGAHVVYQAPPQLYRLMQSVEGLEVLKWTESIPRCDLQCSLMCLPYHFEASLDSLPHAPYLSAPNRDKVTLPSIPEHKRKIGILLEGGTEEIMNSLLHHSQSTFFTFPQSLSHLERCHDVSSQIRDIADMADVISEMDVTITTNHELAHLVGALGKPGIVILDTPTTWQWMTERSDSPWYPSLTLIRKPRGLNWGSINEQLSIAIDFTTHI